MLTSVSITNSFLAMPQGENTKIVSVGLSYERDAFQSSPDKVGGHGDLIDNIRP
jgi:hypothetical protein